MIQDLDFPATGSERTRIIDAATVGFLWDDLSEREKAIFVQGMDKGYYQGVRITARRIIDAFTRQIVGFQP